MNPYVDSDGNSMQIGKFYKYPSVGEDEYNNIDDRPEIGMYEQMSDQGRSMMFLNLNTNKLDYYIGYDIGREIPPIPPILVGGQELEHFIAVKAVKDATNKVNYLKRKQKYLPSDFPLENDPLGLALKELGVATNALDHLNTSNTSNLKKIDENTLPVAKAIDANEVAIANAVSVDEFVEHLRSGNQSTSSSNVPVYTSAVVIGAKKSGGKRKTKRRKSRRNKTKKKRRRHTKRNVTLQI